MNASWWCVGGEGIWVWRYEPIIGIWLLALAAVAGFVRWHRRRGFGISGGTWAKFLGAIVAAVAITEWPLGPLAAGYLVSLSMFRFMIATLVIAPLLLSALPPQIWRRLVPRQVQWMVSWPAGFVAFNTVLIASHMPPVLDTLKATQLGSFAVDASWILAGLLLWWPVINPIPERPGLRDPMRMLYLFLVSIPSMGLTAFFVFAQRPLFALYELAPPLTLQWTPVEDQILAGVVMVIANTFVLWPGLAVMFMKWFNSQQADEIGHGSSLRP